MAREGKLQSELKKKRMCDRQHDKRQRIKKDLTQIYHRIAQGENEEELFVRREELQMLLDKLPRSGSDKRLRNRCRLTGRSRGYYRKFGLSRNMLRVLAMDGCIPGIVKSSW